MAGVTVFGEASTHPLVPHVYHSVWVKWRWSDDWIYVPYLECIRATNALWPKMPEAVFEHHFGVTKEFDEATAYYYPPAVLGGAYIAVLAHSRYVTRLMWVGVVPHEQYGLDATSEGFAGGVNRITAYGLEYLLDQVQITQSYTENGIIDRPLRFNRPRGAGLTRRGNRTDTPDAGGVHGFSEDGDEWTNYDIAYYLMAGYAPLGPTWFLTGQLEMLALVKAEHEFDGLTLFQALNQLADPNRGIGLRVLSDGETGIYLAVFSTLDAPLYLGEGIAPANPFQAFLDANRNDLQVNLQFSELERYDAVWVRGGPIYSCMTLGYGTGELEKGWLTGAETAYKAGSGAGTDAEANDAERTTDKFDTVYQNHRMAGAWNGTAGGQNATPECTYLGYVNPALQAPIWRGEKQFEQQLPFKTANSVDTQPEYRAPFVLVQLSGETDYRYVDRLTVADKTPASVRMSDRDLAVIVTAQGVNHVAAVNHWSGAAATGTDPEYDYETILATVNMATDRHLQVYAYVAPRGYGQQVTTAAPTLPTFGPVTLAPVRFEPVQFTPVVFLPGGGGFNVPGEKFKIKRIDVPDAVAWYVVPNTVVDVEDGAIQRYGIEVSAAQNNLERDDGAVLRQVAALALAHYARPRSTLTMELRELNVAYGPGTLLRAVRTGWHVSEVGSVVTAITWDFRGQRTHYATGHAELDFEAIGAGLLSGEG